MWTVCHSFYLMSELLQASLKTGTSSNFICGFYLFCMTTASPKLKSFQFYPVKSQLTRSVFSSVKITLSLQCDCTGL